MKERIITWLSQVFVFAKIQYFVAYHFVEAHPQELMIGTISGLLVYFSYKYLNILVAMLLITIYFLGFFIYTSGIMEQFQGSLY